MLERSPVAAKYLTLKGVGVVVLGHLQAQTAAFACDIGMLQPLHRPHAATSNRSSQCMALPRSGQLHSCEAAAG